MHTRAGGGWISYVTRFVPRLDYIAFRRARRAGAQLSVRGVYRGAAKRFAEEMNAAGFVVASDDGWTR